MVLSHISADDSAASKIDARSRSARTRNLREFQEISALDPSTKTGASGER